MLKLKNIKVEFRYLTDLYLKGDMTKKLILTNLEITWAEEVIRIV